jgi:hypothetical protein
VKVVATGTRLISAAIKYVASHGRQEARKPMRSTLQSRTTSHAFLHVASAISDKVTNGRRITNKAGRSLREYASVRD